MMEQQVTVIAVEDGVATVRGRRASACGDCAGKASCSTMGSWVERVIDLRLPNTLHADVGDEVVIYVPDHALLQVAFRLYGIPMLLFIAVGLLARTIATAAGWPSVDAIAAVAGFLAVGGSYLFHLVDGKQAASFDIRMLRYVTPSHRHLLSQF